MAPLVEARGVHKSYWLGEKEIHVLRGASFSLEPGEMASLVGPSGVGKSTFLHVIGTLDPPTAGTVLFEGQDAFSMSEERLAGFRNNSIGFVFQFHYLLPEFTALQNAAMPGLIHRQPREKAEAQAREMLEIVGLGDRLDHKPGELSGGEQQRVALARALVLKPRGVTSLTRFQCAPPSSVRKTPPLRLRCVKRFTAPPMSDSTIAKRIFEFLR